MQIVQSRRKFSEKRTRKNVKICSFFNFECVVCAVLLSQRFGFVENFLGLCSDYLEQTYREDSKKLQMSKKFGAEIKKKLFVFSIVLSQFRKRLIWGGESKE